MRTKRERRHAGFCRRRVTALPRGMKPPEKGKAKSETNIGSWTYTQRETVKDTGGNWKDSRRRTPKRKRNGDRKHRKTDNKEDRRTEKEVETENNYRHEE